MTSRTLTATPIPADTTPHVIAEACASLDLNPLLDPETRLWYIIDELFEMGKQYTALADKTARLLDQIDDPALASHPKRDEAAERYNRWLDDLDHMDDEARLLRHWIADCWLKLPARRRKVLLDEPGWPRASSPARLAGELWILAKAGREKPSGKCPF